MINNKNNLDVETDIANERDEAWEWSQVFINSLPLGVCNDSPVGGHDAPIAVSIGRRADQPLTRRICFSIRSVITTEKDAVKKVKVLFSNYDAIVSFDGENICDIHKTICIAMSNLGIIPDATKIWDLTAEEFLNYAKTVQRRFKGVKRNDPDSIDETLMLVAFSDPSDPFGSDENYKTWEGAVSKLERVTGLTANEDVHALYSIEEEANKFKG